MTGRQTSWMLRGLAGLGAPLLLCLGSTFAAEPLIDTGVFGVSRSVAINQVKEGKFRQALQEEEKALKIAEDRYGPVHPLLVPIFNDLASLHRYLAEYGKAEEETKWGLALREKNMGLGDLSVADSQDQLAALYNDLGRYPEAEILEKKALLIRQENSTNTLSGMAQTLGLLGRIEMNLGRDNMAQTLLGKAVDIQDKDPHSDVGLTLHLLNSLAEACRSQGLLSEAQSALEKTLKIAQKNFPSDDVQVADAMENLADFYRAQKREEKAKPLYQSAFLIDKPLVGPYAQYPALPYMKRLAKAYEGVGNLPSAEDLWQKTLKAETEVFGTHHPQVSLDLMRLAEVERALGQNNLAAENLKQSVEILGSFFKEGYPLLDRARALLEKVSK